MRARLHPGRALALLVLLGAFAASAPAEAGAQQVPAPEGAAPTARPPISISPRGAFLRAMALPGWGHAAIGAHTRGGFYFVAEGAAAYTLLRSRRRLHDVRDRMAFREGLLRGRLTAQGVTEPADIEAGLDADGALAELRALEDSRAAQQEDMVALGIFLVFLSGADAYVSAHLSRFPEPLDVGVVPAAQGRVEVVARITLPN